MNEPSDLDNALAEAGSRLRGLAPDDAATRTALREVHTHAGTNPEPPRRRLWRTLALATGLTGAAAAAAFVLVGNPSQDTVRVVPADTAAPASPVSTPTSVLDDSVPPQNADPATPTTVLLGTGSLDVTDLINATPPPLTSGAALPDGWTVTNEFRSTDCFRMSLDTPDRRVGSAAGCISPNRLRSDERYVTEMSGEVYAVVRLDDATPPTLTLEPIPNWKTSTCGIVGAFAGELASDSVIEIVACDQTVTDAPTAIAARVPQEEGAEFEYFGHGSRIGQGEVALAAPSPIAGLPNIAVFFSSSIDGTRCAAMVAQASSGWTEQCWTAASDPASSVVLIDAGIAQIDLNSQGAPTGVWLDVRGIPSTGCSLADISEMFELLPVDRGGSALTAMICGPTQGTVDVAPALLRNIGADGGFIEFERVDQFAAWTSLGGGTDGEAVQALPFPAHAIWSSWPGQTTALSANEFKRQTLNGQTFDNAEEVAAAVIVSLNESGSDEFPVMPTIITIMDSLIVIGSTVADDDSVSGVVDYVHLVEGDGGSLVIGQWFAASICGRGDSGPTAVCI
jgi:hypothetical protein